MRFHAQIAAAAMALATTPAFAAKIAGLSKEGLAAVVDGLIAVGDLKEPFDRGTLIDQSLLDDDLRRRP